MRHFELDIDEERSASWGLWANRRISKHLVDWLSRTAVSMEDLQHVRLSTTFFNNETLTQSIEMSYTHRQRPCSPRSAKGLPLQITHIAGAIALMLVGVIAGLITLALECMHKLTSKYKAERM